MSVRWEEPVARRLALVRPAAERVPDEAAYRELIALRARMQRGLLGLTQRDVAAHDPALSRHFVGAVERGAGALDTWRLLLLADALGTTLTWLTEPRHGDTRLPGT